MVQAVRVVSVQRGVDPAGLALVAFGGAGPLHACALAEALGMPAVVVPPRAGVLSAVGMLGAPAPGGPGAFLGRIPPTIAAPKRPPPPWAWRPRAGADGGRGRGGLRLPLRRPEPRAHGGLRSAAFDAEHARRNGFTMADTAIEVVAIRASARWPSPVDLSGPGRRTDRAGPVVGSGGHRRAGLHHLGGAGLAGRTAHPSGSWLLTRAG